LSIMYRNQAGKNLQKGLIPSLFCPVSLWARTLFSSIVH
jgi:hypothetical protein